MGSPTLSALEKTIFDWFTAEIPAGFATGGVIWMGDNSPRPQTPYIGLNRISLKKVGRDYHGPVDALTGNRKLLGTRELTISAHAYGPDGFQALEDFRTLTDTEAAVAAFFAGSLAVIEVMDVIDAPIPYQQQFKEHAQADFIFRTHSYLADGDEGVGYIERVDLELNTVNEAGVSSSENLIIDTTP
jgi:hypothetical protein